MHPSWDHSHLVPSQDQHEPCCWVAPAPFDASTETLLSLSGKQDEVLSSAVPRSSWAQDVSP